MAELHDPDKPAGFVVSVDKDTGVATRNDGRLLQPASKNPWFVLMTIAGEPKGFFDDEIIDKNRRYWNGWSCSEMSKEERAELAQKMELDTADLEPLTEAERAEIATVFRKRLPEGTECRTAGLEKIATVFRALDAPGGKLPSPERYIDMSEIQFFNTVVLKNWIFSGRASFGSSTFSGDASFGSSTFSGRASFGSSTFSGDAYFDSSTFSGPAYFDSSTFSGDASFGSSTFSGPAYFDSSTFSGDAYFDSSTFSGSAYFDSSTFSGSASFGSSTFSGDADFESSTFSGPASFGSSTFSGSAYFGSSTFSRDADFESSTFSGSASFGSSTFSGSADFSDGGFGGATSFSGAYFKGAVPLFYQRAFHQNTDIPILPVNWPEITVENAGKSKRAYTRLRQIMNGLHKPDAEAFFARQEMRCDGELHGGMFRIISKAYGAVSGYGHSILRPALWLGGMIGICWIFLGSYLTGLTGYVGSAGIWKGLGLSVANTFPYLGFNRLYFGAEFYQSLPVWAKVMGAGQTLLGGVFLFFLLLGLRNRFRLK